MPVFKRNDKEFLFVHIPKTGGTSICNMVENDKLELSGNVDVDGNLICLNHLTINEMLKRNYITKKRLSKMEVITVVRNPWDRLVSLYFSGYSKRQTFESFVKMVCNETRHYKQYCFYPRIHTVEIDNAFRPQYSFFEGINPRNVQIYKFENYKETYNSLSEKFYGKHCDLKHLCRSEARKKKNYKNYYNDAVASLVETFFKEDVETFGYEY